MTSEYTHQLEITSPSGNTFTIQVTNYTHNYQPRIKPVWYLDENDRLRLFPNQQPPPGLQVVRIGKYDRCEKV